MIGTGRRRAPGAPGGRRRAGRAGRRATGLVALGFFAGIGLSVVILAFGGGGSPTAGWRAGVAVPASLAAGMHLVDERVPVEVVADVTAWTGSQVLTFGVQRDRNVGAVYEPGSGRWRAMPAPPFGVVLRGPVAVWTGDEWVVAGVLCDRLAPQSGGSDGSRGRDGCVPGRLAVAAYDPAHDLWQPVHTNPVPAEWGFGPGHAPTIGRAVGTLDRAVVFLIDGEYYSLRRDDGTWTWLPDPTAPDRPGPDAEMRVCALGPALAATGAVRPDDDPTIVATLTVSVLRPGALAWDERAAVAPPPRTAAVATACTPAGVLAYVPDLSWVAQWDLRTGAWEQVGPAPLGDGDGPLVGPFVGTGAGTRVVFAGEGAAVSYDPRLRTWSELAPGLPPHPAGVVWTSARTGLSFDARALLAYRASDPGR